MSRRGTAGSVFRSESTKLEFITPLERCCLTGSSRSNLAAGSALLQILRAARLCSPAFSAGLFVEHHRLHLIAHDLFRDHNFFDVAL